MSSHRARTLYRIDPQTSNVQAEIEVDMLACGLLLTTADAVWVTSCEDGPSKRIDPDTDEVVEETAAGVLPPVTAEDGSTWQVRGLDQLVDRIDPATGAAIESVPTAAVAPGRRLRSGVVAERRWHHHARRHGQLPAEQCGA
ncbi:MAG: hypothetical protein M3337_07665, partial [Actinomycetota bacterium]|nr:hypothetical protein [Actinomycetota bacterium]